MYRLIVYEEVQYPGLADWRSTSTENGAQYVIVTLT